MCKDGKCHERAGQTRNVIVSMGIAARELSKLAEHPHMVIKTMTHIGFVPADPEMHSVPGITVIMEVYPTTTDAEVAQKADSYLENARRPPPVLIQVLEQLFGLPSTSDTPVDAETAQKAKDARASLETSARIAAETHANGF